MTNVLRCTFHGSKTRYSYLNEDESVVVGDCVVIEAASNKFAGGTMLKVVDVMEVLPEDGRATRTIVCKVDTSNYAPFESKRIKAAMKSEEKQVLEEAYVNNKVLKGLQEQLNELEVATPAPAAM